MKTVIDGYVVVSYGSDDSVTCHISRVDDSSQIMTLYLTKLDKTPVWAIVRAVVEQLKHRATYEDARMVENSMRQPLLLEL